MERVFNGSPAMDAQVVDRDQLGEVGEQPGGRLSSGAQVDGAAQIGQACVHNNLTSRLPWVEVEGMAWKAMAQGQGMVEECGCQLMEGGGSPGWVVMTQNRRMCVRKSCKVD